MGIHSTRFITPFQPHCANTPYITRLLLRTKSNMVTNHFGNGFKAQVKKKGELAFASSLSKRRRGAPVMLNLAERTGLEPATPGVTGRYSNQLNYRSNRKTVVGVDGVEPPTFCL